MGTILLGHAIAKPVQWSTVGKKVAGSVLIGVGLVGADAAIDASKSEKAMVIYVTPPPLPQLGKAEEDWSVYYTGGLSASILLIYVGISAFCK